MTVVFDYRGKVAVLKLCSENFACLTYTWLVGASQGFFLGLCASLYHLYPGDIKVLFLAQNSVLNSILLYPMLCWHPHLEVSQTYPNLPCAKWNSFFSCFLPNLFLPPLHPTPAHSSPSHLRIWHHHPNPIINHQHIIWYALQNIYWIRPFFSLFRLPPPSPDHCPSLALQQAHDTSPYPHSYLFLIKSYGSPYGSFNNQIWSISS